ncbi:MAG: hypothetical protein NC122_07450 [Faecalibacterium sp.]|nr:hypothetical protein [Ruminococcus sp.]MCM1392169.1 hypothetical protein [Ruminococcus sp.]MCM1486027.1 hypothetical protein [Faecalibacterium sp.]
MIDEAYEEKILCMLPEEEAEMLRLYRSLSEKQQDIIFDTIYNIATKKDI